VLYGDIGVLLPISIKEKSRKSLQGRGSKPGMEESERHGHCLYKKRVRVFRGGEFRETGEVTGTMPIFKKKSVGESINGGTLAKIRKGKNGSNSTCSSPFALRQLIYGGRNVEGAKMKPGTRLEQFSFLSLAEKRLIKPENIEPSHGPHSTSFVKGGDRESLKKSVLDIWGNFTLWLYVGVKRKTTKIILRSCKKTDKKEKPLPQKSGGRKISWGGGGRTKSLRCTYMGEVWGKMLFSGVEIEEKKKKRLNGGTPEENLNAQGSSWETGSVDIKSRVGGALRCPTRAFNGPGKWGGVSKKESSHGEFMPALD